MNAEAVLETLISTANQVDNQWSMYIVVHLGLFWFFFLVHRPLLFIERAIALFAYGAFDYINGSALINTYTFLEALRLDLLNNFSAELANVPRVEETLSAFNYSETTQLILVTHGVAFCIVALFLVFRNAMVRRYRRFYDGATVAE
jgi:hypothetical protein